MAGADPAPHFTAQTRLLVIAPHPDDETIATGMLIQRVRAAGGRVDIVLLTDGDNNPWPQRFLERRLHIGAADRARWAHRRRTEMLRALDHLGVGPGHLHPLGWPDLGVTTLLLTADNVAVHTVAALLAQLQPNLLVMPALADRHPDHATAHVLLRLALAGVANPPLQWTYLVHGAAQDPSALEFEVDGSGEQRAAKQAALAAHASQMALSGSRMQRLAGRAERYVPTPDTVAAGDALPWSPPAWLRSVLRLSVVDARGAHSWRWSRAPLQIDGAGTVRLARGADSGGPRFARLVSRLPSPWIFDRWGWCELG